MYSTTATTGNSTENPCKRKGTPGGAPIHTQDNGTTSDALTQAQFLFSLIGEGIEHALTRPKDANVDRQLRRLIENANNGDDVIINVGSGYFRPGDDDSAEVEMYLSAERKKARNRLRTLSNMERNYDRRYE